MGLAKTATGRIDLPVGYVPKVLALEAVVLIAQLLRFALINHRSIDRDAKCVWGQVGLMVGFLVLSVVAFTAAQRLVLQR